MSIHGNTNQKKIIVIDDDNEFLDEMQDLLSWSGYAPITISDSSKAEAAIRHHKPNLILLDLNMQPVSGAMIAESLQKDPATAQIPIIVITGNYSQERHSILRNKYRIIHCLQKPLNPMDLLTLIEGTL